MVESGGSSLRFQLDPWCGIVSLTESFLELYWIASNPDAVQELLSFDGTSFHWIVTWDWELGYFALFMDSIYQGVFKQGEADAICWDSSSRKVFEVKSFYKALFMTAYQVFPLRSVWKPKVPTKVSFFLWTTVLGKVLTMDNLRKCGLVVIDWCCMCKRAEEITDHLLLHCLMA